MGNPKLISPPTNELQKSHTLKNSKLREAGLETRK